MSRTAIATLCVGKEYLSQWEKFCRPNWAHYALRHGFDLKVFTAPLDTSARAGGRSAAWQKCLILEALADYDRVVWLDADIVINREAPSVTMDVPLGKIGAVISGDYLHPDLRLFFLRRTIRPVAVTSADAEEAWRNDQASFYAQAGIACGTHDIVQTGVLVLDPSHRALLRQVYDMYPAEMKFAEQLPLSAAILNSGVLHRMDSKFNTVFVERAVLHYGYLFDAGIQKSPMIHHLTTLAVRMELLNSYFLHFAHEPGYLRYVLE